MEQKKRGRKVKSFKDRIHPLTIYVKGEVIEKNGGELNLRAKIEKELKK